MEEISAEETARVEEIFSAHRAPLARIEGYLARERDALRGCRMARYHADLGELATDYRLAAAERGWSFGEP